MGFYEEHPPRHGHRTPSELAEDEMARVSARASPKGRLTDFGFAPKWD